MSNRYGTLSDVWVEQSTIEQLGSGLVQITTEGKIDESIHTLVGQITPAKALELAVHLMTAAGRASYEQDLILGLQSLDMEEDGIRPLMAIARAEQMMRETRAVIESERGESG